MKIFVYLLFVLLVMGEQLSEEWIVQNKKYFKN